MIARSIMDGVFCGDGKRASDAEGKTCFIQRLKQETPEEQYADNDKDGYDDDLNETHGLSPENQFQRRNSRSGSLACQSPKL
ncbi:MAG: hypothetical protein ACXW3C_14560 [Pyrinomonadaceae bacterium]